MEAQSPAPRRRATETLISPEQGRLLPYIKELVQSRDLLMFLAWKNVKVQYAQTALGPVWLVLRPLVHAAVLTILFGRIARFPSDGAPYPLFALAGLSAWLYFAGVAGRAASSLSANKSLLTKIYIPRMYLPLSPMLGGLVDLAVTLLLFMLVATFWYGRSPVANPLWLPLPLLLLLFTSVGVALWLSALAGAVPDTRQIMGQGLQLLMFATPVVWPLSLLSARLGVGPEFISWYALYPMVGVIEGFRHALLGTGEPPLHLLGLGSAGATVLLVTGILYFRRHEREFADMV